MGATTTFLAVDLGASSGRVMAAAWDGRRFDLRELHRFPNGPVRVLGHLYWDVLRLWHEVQTGLARYASESATPPASIGVDTWGVDFALLDDAGRLLGNPYHYRDRRTEVALDWVEARTSSSAVYAQTGIQRLPINTLYQLASMRASTDPQLSAAATLLLMPDLFHYWLTGQKAVEYTNASTTQMLDARGRVWATPLLEDLGLPTTLLPSIVSPGAVLGDLLPDVRSDLGFRHAVPVVATATHDTASAVAAVPGLDLHSAYISSGTWSLIGVELPGPILTDRARRLNFTNEGGVGGKIRFLKNVGGLWLLQECQRIWQRRGESYAWPELVALAAHATPRRSLIDPDDSAFLSPNDMPAAIRAACRASGQPEPDSVGAMVRCCLESLALKYRWVIESLESLTGNAVATIRVVGGGSQNTLLCQLTADACRRPVVAGPVEATALGNVLVQAVALGHLPDIAAARAALADSFNLTTYHPRPASDWDSAYTAFKTLLPPTD